MREVLTHLAKQRPHLVRQRIGNRGVVFLRIEEDILVLQQLQTVLFTLLRGRRVDILDLLQTHLRQYAAHLQRVAHAGQAIFPIFIDVLVAGVELIDTYYA